MRVDTTQSVYREHPGLDDDPEFEPEDLVHVGFFENLEILAHVGGKTFEVAPLAFGEEHVEGKG